MAARHEHHPEHLWHYSEDPGITRFLPHVPATNPDQPPMVWTIDEVHAPLLWFPRDCPRITFWSDDGSPADRLGPTTASRVHAMEPGWVERMRACRLFVYRFAVDGFRPWPDADGYWVADDERAALDVAPVGDLFELHRRARRRAAGPRRPAAAPRRRHRVGLPVLHDADAEHQSCSGRRVGNRMTSRMLWVSVRSITRRSIPMPRPAVGGRPYSSARR